MEVKMIEGKVYEQLRQCIKALLSRTSKLRPKPVTEIWYNNGEVCQLLGVSLRTLQTYRNKRLIAFYKLEGKILYKMSDIRGMLENNYHDVWKLKR